MCIFLSQKIRKRKGERSPKVEAEKAQKNASLLSHQGVEAEIEIQGVVVAVEVDHRIKQNGQDVPLNGQGGQEVDQLATGALQQIGTVT